MRRRKSTFHKGGRPSRKKLVKSNLQSLYRGVVPPMKELKDDISTIYQLKFLCIATRNFKNTSLRKSIQRLGKGSISVIDSFKQFWLSLKIFQIIEPSTRKLCYLLLRNGWNSEFQEFYLKSLDRFSQSTRFTNRTNFHRDEYWNYSELQIDVIESLWHLEPELWVPMSVFPRISFDKESKMELAFEPVSLNIPLFSEMVYKFLVDLKVNHIDIPSPEMVLKVGSARYNDGGRVKRDFELPTVSLNSGFLYQKFCPKPRQPREVWLPDKVTKINNNFWMFIGRSILTRVPYYPDSDPRVTYSKIRERLSNFEYFDFPGYGFQYPREYLVIVAETIARLYSHPDIFECLDIFKRICGSVKVQMDDGLFRYPPRGIGLGYYEDLKTIGTMAVIHYHKFNPISIYGDQGLLPSMNYKVFVKAFSDLGFIISRSRMDTKRLVKWAGWTMSTTLFYKIRSTFEPLVSAFRSQYHWERKMILRSFAKEHRNLYLKYEKFIPTLYESSFGYEYYKGDAFSNFENGGLMISTPRLEGNLKTWKVERLISPSDIIHDDFIYNTPFFTEWKRADSKKFSLLRKSVYKNSRPCSTMILDYASPRIELSNNRVPELPHMARVISDSMESKLLVNHLQTSGKFTMGLTSEQMDSALRLCSMARNPYEAYATGGYRYLTVWHALPRVSSEWVELNEILHTSVSMIYSHRATFYNTFEVPINIEPSSRPKRKRIGDNKTIVTDLDPAMEPRQSLTRVTLDMLRETVHRKEVPRDDTLRPVTDILSDIHTRQLCLVDDNISVYEDIIEDYLEDIE